jgi:hypothetical protein
MTEPLTRWSRSAAESRRGARRPEYARRFGLSGDAVRPLFGDRPGAAGLRPPPPTGPGVGIDLAPDALAVYQPGLSRRQRLVARLGTSRLVTLGRRPRPLQAKGVLAVGAGAVAGTMLAQPFDPVTYLAPLFGLVIGGVGGAAGWISVRGRGSVTITVEQWRPQLDTISRILRNADRLGQPFASPASLRVTLHSALWHAVEAVGQPGDADVLEAFDHQLAALLRATETALSELESPSIAARKAAVSERLADAVSELEMASSWDLHQIVTGDDRA